MTDDLATIRDFLRYAVSRFRKANLVFGHGAADALDEAAFIILETLNLPIEDINPWLDARLTAEERHRLAALISARVETRKPAPYLLNKAYIQGEPFYVDERVIVPRSYIGELLAREDFALMRDPEGVEAVLDLCTGSGALAVLAALAFPNAAVSAVDVSPDALDVARKNLEMHELEARVRLYEGDLFAPLAGQRFDLILTNPPYVDTEAMAALPPEYRAEPALALAGGPDGLDIVRRILAEAPSHLSPNGGLLCEIGAGRDILDAEYPHLNFLWLDSEESEGEVFWLWTSDFVAAG